jgi:hypothetical protein
MEVRKERKGVALAVEPRSDNWLQKIAARKNGGPERKERCSLGYRARVRQLAAKDRHQERWRSLKKGICSSGCRGHVRQLAVKDYTQEFGGPERKEALAKAVKGP